MSIISIPFTFSPGGTIVSSQVNQNFSTIYSDYNGSIGNTNLSSSIVISDTKLAQIADASKVNGTALTNLAGIPSGAGVIPSANLPSTVNPYIKVSEAETSGTTGGGSTAGSFQTRVLNTKDSDTSSIGTLSSNQISLPAGTYIVHASSPYCSVGAILTRLQDITHSTTLLNGTSEYNVESTGSDFGTVRSRIDGLITLSSTSALAVQYRCSISTGSNDLGNPSSFGTEVYTVAEFTKIS